MMWPAVGACKADSPVAVRVPRIGLVRLKAHLRDQLLESHWKKELTVFCQSQLGNSRCVLDGSFGVQSPRVPCAPARPLLAAITDGADSVRPFAAAFV